ncbi:MAG: S26 family signal peptidase, partial [Phenylobacterium sp.]|nr:S26 family signal peptidase [Phenylobacterium sp.]
MAASAAVALLAIMAVTQPAPRLIWNASASVPIGLYAISPPRPPAAGDLVAVEPPAPLADFLSAGGYLPPAVPLLKHVAALPG